LAERALKLAGGVSPILHRTLAAACAESGRFDDAIATAERGRALPEREGWLTNLPPSSPNTDSTNPSATPACNCTKI